MVFSSLEFLFLFLPITFILYFTVPMKYLKWRNLVLLITSLAFYGWGEPIYVFIMVFSIMVDYTCGYFVSKYIAIDKKNIAKRYVVASIIINILILGFFKYADFFINNLRLLPFLSFLEPLGLSLPIGISFYTFQTMSYTIDLYRRDAKVQKNITSFGAYVTLFPQLIAGPIIRYKDVDEQLRKRDETITLFASGIRTFMAGFAKKVLLGNIAGEMWQIYSSAPIGERTILGSWIGIICYAFQIYFDFSGYSDMAIGLGKMFGFKFLENFNYPYISKNITEFWRRWHMSLSTWFRDYVYFQLGGSRCSPLKNVRNLLIVWFLTGFWHGASWNFIIWGLYYFVLLMCERIFLLKLLERVPVVFSHIYTLLFVLFGWLIFVFEDIGAGAIYFGNMLGIGTVEFASRETFYDLFRNLLFFAILIIAATPFPKKLFYRFYENSQLVKLGAYVCGAIVFIVGISYLVDSSFNPFLYFRF